MNSFLGGFLSIAFIVFFATTAFAEKALLRIVCDEEREPIKITINGKYSGECPMDISVNAGSITLYAEQASGPEMARIFTKKFDIAGGAARRVEIELSAPQLTAAGKRARLIAAQKKEQQEAEQEIKAASNGDMKAMENVANRYASGKGVKQDPAQARYWQEKFKESKNAADMRALTQRANAGNIPAMIELAQRYETGNGTIADPAKSLEWSQKAKAAEVQKAAKEKQAAEARKRAEVERRLRQHTTTPNIDKLSKENPVASTVSAPFATFSDALSSHEKIAEKNKIQQELSTNAAAWAEPDSLIAKVHAQRQSGSEAAR